MRFSLHAYEWNKSEDPFSLFGMRAGRDMEEDFRADEERKLHVIL